MESGTKSTERTVSGERATAQTTAVIQQATPIGAIVSFYGADTSKLAPGWLPCDGGKFDAAQYPALYSFLGDDNVLPDLRGYFLRGLDDYGSVDPDGKGRKVGDPKADAFGAHTHPIASSHATQTDGTSAADPPAVAGYPKYPATPQTGPAGGPETRPKNKAVHFIIFAGVPQH